MPDVRDLPFDQYQRYELVRALLESVRADGERFRILDVGGRTALLREFLPLDQVELVDVVPSAVEGLEQAMAPSRSVRARALLASLLLLLAETDALHLALASRGATRLLICAQRPAALVMETIVACRLGCRLCRARSLVIPF